MAVKTDNTNEVGLHRWVQDRLSAYIDDELSASEKGLVEGHLGECARCADDLRTLRQTVDWVRALPMQPVPRPFTIPVNEPAASRLTFGWLYPYLKASAAAAAVLLIITLCVDVVRLAPTSMMLSQAPMPAPVAPVVPMTASPTATASDQLLLPAFGETSEMASAEHVPEETTASQPSKGQAVSSEIDLEAAMSPSAEGASLFLQGSHADEVSELGAAPPAPAAIQPQTEGRGAAPLAAPATATRASPAPAPLLRQAAPPVPPHPELPHTEEAFNAAATAMVPSGAARPSPTAAPVEAPPAAGATEAALEKEAVAAPTAEAPYREATAVAVATAGHVVWRAVQAFLLLTLVASLAGVLMLRRR